MASGWQGASSPGPCRGAQASPSPRQASAAALTQPPCGCSVSDLPGTVSLPWRCSHRSPMVTDEETEAQREEVTWLKSHSEEEDQPGFEPGAG